MKVALKELPEPEDQKLYSPYSKEKLEALAYTSVVKDSDGRGEARPLTFVEVRQEIKQVPDVALRVDGGWLAGSNRGEWGGELVFIPENGKAVKILDENIEDIFSLDNRYIATTGLAHLMSDKGMVYELYQDKNDSWYHKEWLKLPSAPRSSRIVETGEILIDTYSGGSVLLSSKGSMRMANCE